MLSICEIANCQIGYRNIKRNENAPEFIYSILYDKQPPRLRGRTVDHPEKIINGVGIDKSIPTKAIKELNNIPEIEPRASCQGNDEARPTFFIFRFKNNPDENYIERFCQEVNKNQKYKAGYGTGGEGFYRIGVTGHLWFDGSNKKEFEDWWLNLPNIIKKSANQ